MVSEDTKFRGQIRCKLLRILHLAPQALSSNETSSHLMFNARESLIFCCWMPFMYSFNKLYPYSCIYIFFFLGGGSWKKWTGSNWGVIDFLDRCSGGVMLFHDNFPEQTTAPTPPVNNDRSLRLEPYQLFQIADSFREKTA